MMNSDQSVDDESEIEEVEVEKDESMGLLQRLGN